MKKIAASLLAVASIMLLSGCSWNTKMNTETKTPDVPRADDAMMKKEEAPSDAMMKVEVKGETDAMMQK